MLFSSFHISISSFFSSLDPSLCFAFTLFAILLLCVIFRIRISMLFICSYEIFLVPALAFSAIHNLSSSKMCPVCFIYFDDCLFAPFSKCTRTNQFLFSLFGKHNFFFFVILRFYRSCCWMMRAGWVKFAVPTCHQHAK